MKKLFTFYFSLFTSLIKSESGQAMPYFFMMMIVLIMSWMMLINVGKLMNERMMMQNAADNAALSVACYRARVLNKLGQINRILASTLFDGPVGFGMAMGNMDPIGLTIYHSFAITKGAWGACPQIGAPIMPQMLNNDATKVAHLFDMPHNFCPGTDNGSQTCDTFVKMTKGLVDMLSLAQKGLRIPYPGGAAILCKKIAKMQQKNAAGDLTGADMAAVIPWGGANGYKLGLEQSEKGVYFKTESLCISIPPNKAMPRGLHIHISNAEEMDSDQKTWLYANKDEFYKHHKITVLATKNAAAGYPFGKRLFGNISWPSIQTMASAAVYNDGGPMFVEYQKDKESTKIKEVIEAYKKAEKKGWDAHLVPLGSPFIH